MAMKSIRTVMAITIGSVILLVQAVLVYLVAASIYSEIITSKKHEMTLLVDTISKSAADFGNQQMELVRGASKIPVIRDFLLSGKNGDFVGEIVKGMSLAAPDVNSFYVFDATGKQVVLCVQGKPAALNALADREYVKVSLDGKEGYSNAPTKSLATGKLIVSVTVPVFDQSGKVIGGVGMSYGVDKLIDDYITATKVGETGHPFFLSSKGVVVGHPDREMLLKDISREQGIGAMLTSPQGEGLRERDGKEKNVSWKRVPGWDWILAFSMDTDEVQSMARKERNMMILLGSLAVLGLIGVCLVALEKIAVKPLKLLEEYASGVASGDLDRPLGLRLSNEIGKLADSLRRMVENLKGKIAEADEKSRLAKEESAHAAHAAQMAEQACQAAERAKSEGMIQAASELESVVEILGSASKVLSEQIGQSSRGAEEEARRVAETATAMEEMNATVLEVARNASQAAETADMARRKAQDGSRAVTQVVQGIGEVQSQALAMKSDITSLGRQAEGIGQILGVISDIADQTNLLALNAAIEAARAGDAGRGFAVVADEVRKLAEKTMTATKEVGEAIKGIQEGTKRNIDNVEQSVLKIDATTGLAGESGDALREIVDLVDRTTDQVRSIATASEQQSAASEEINRSIEDVRRISSDSSDSMHRSSDAVEGLARQAVVLKELIDQMKSGGGAPVVKALSQGRKASPGRDR